MQTLSDAINKLNAIPDLPRDRRRDLISAIQRVSDYLGRPINVIPTEPLKLRPLLEGIHHVQIGVSAKTLMNVKANLARALREVGMLPNKEVNTEQTNAWQAFMAVSTSKFHSVALSRFITYCSVRDIEPQSVNHAVVDAFEAHISATSLTVNLTRERKQVVMTWNIMARLHNGKFASLPIGKHPN